MAIAVWGIILSSCDWNHPDVPFSKLSVLPTNAIAISSWADPEEAFTIVAKRMRETVDQLRAKKRANELASERGMDYDRLRDLLKSGQWKAADQEMADRMCEVMGRQEDGCLREEDIQNFPCIDLRTIDQLWVKHSRGKFGFSVQKKIWQECGSPTDDNANWKKFGEVVEWKKGDVWKIYNELTFEISAPSEHLPSPVYFKIGLLGRRWWVWVVSSPASRLADCSIE